MIALKGEDAKLLIVAILAVVAIVLASISIVFPEEDDDEETDGETNSTPTAQINVDTTTVGEGETIYFNGSASTDPDGIIIEYTWDFGDGLKDSGMYSNYDYSTMGTYTVVLKVIDDKGDSDTDSEVITVTESDETGDNQLPVAVITMEKTTVEEENYIYFNGSGSSDEDGIIIEYTWDFGDGVMDSGMYSNHIYKDEGSYNVTLTVIDDDGGTDTSEIAINVISDPKAVIYFTESSFSPGDFSGTIVVISEPVNLTDVSMTIFDISENTSVTQDPIESEATLVIHEGMVCSFNDDNNNEKLDWGDKIYIEFGGTGDTLKLIYKTTGSIIAEYSFISVPTTPTGALDFHESTQTVGLYTGSFVSLSRSVYINDTIITITDDSLGNSESRNLTPGVTLQIPGGMNCTYYDNNQNWKMDGGDTIRVYNAASGDIIKFTYIPTMSTIAQYTFV